MTNAPTDPATPPSDITSDSSSSSSVTVSVDVYPTKELPVSNEIADAVKGSVADGFEVTGITIQPETATVAAAPDVLEGLTELLVEPVALNGARQSFSQRTKISRLTDFKYVSPEQVYVNIAIEEEVVNALLTDVRFTFVDKPEDMTVSWRREEFSVRVTDMDPDNVGQERAGVLIEGVESTGEVLDWADVVLATGTTLANGTLDGLPTAKPSVFYGVTISGAAALLGYERYCPCGT